MIRSGVSVCQGASAAFPGSFLFVRSTPCFSATPWQSALQRTHLSAGTLTSEGTHLFYPKLFFAPRTYLWRQSVLCWEWVQSHLPSWRTPSAGAGVVYCNCGGFHVSKWDKWRLTVNNIWSKMIYMNSASCVTFTVYALRVSGYCHPTDDPNRRAGNNC